MARSPYTPATAFVDALRSFETGGLTFRDVLAEVDGLLANGASPTQLLETLERRAAIEPLSDSDYDELAGILDAAVARAATDAAPAAESATASPSGAGAAAGVVAPAVAAAVASPPASLGAGISAQRPGAVSDGEAAAVARATAIAAELAAVRADVEEALRASESYQTEARVLRTSLAKRDVSLAEVTYALGQRDTQLAALQREHAKLVPALEARVSTLVAELTAADAELAAEQTKAQESHRSLSAHMGSVDAVRSRTEEALRAAELAQKEVRTLQVALVARETELGTLQREHSHAVAAFEGRSRVEGQLKTDLQAALEHATALAGEVGVVRTELELERRRVQESQKALTEGTATARSRAEVASREAEQRRHEARALRDSLGARDADIAALRQEQATAERALEAGTKKAAQAEAESRSARARAEALAADLAVARDGAAALEGKLAVATSRLGTVRAEFDALQAASEAAAVAHDREPAPPSAVRAEAAPARQQESAESRDQLARVHKEFDAADSFIDKMRSTTGEAVSRAADSRAARRAAQRARDLAHPAPPPARAAETVKLKTLPAGALARWMAGGLLSARGLLASVRELRGGRLTKGRALALGGAVLLAAVLVIASSLHHKAPPSVVAAVLTPGTVLHDCADCPAMTVLPAGRFKQGATRSDVGSAFERPQHWVSIGRPFALSTNAVTVDEFRRFITATGARVQGCDIYDGEWQHRADSSWQNPGFVQLGTHPVTCVSFDDATAYAKWLSSTTGQRYRLPSASEWEYAAFAGGESAKPWGRQDAGACAHANVADQSAAHQYPGWQVFPCTDGYVNTAPVGSFQANAFGINDVLGNVFQWTEDCWNMDYTGAPIDGSSRADGDCTKRELRGGSWFSTPAFVRATYRNHFAVDYRTSSVGIRLVREIAP